MKLLNFLQYLSDLWSPLLRGQRSLSLSLTMDLTFTPAVISTAAVEAQELESRRFDASKVALFRGFNGGSDSPQNTCSTSHSRMLTRRYIYIDLGIHIAYFGNELLFIFRCIAVCRLTGSWICWYVKLRQDALEHDLATWSDKGSFYKIVWPKQYWRFWLCSSIEDFLVRGAMPALQKETVMGAKYMVSL